MTASPTGATPAPDAGMARGYYPLIDVLRGFAALSVVVFHVIELLHWTDFPIEGPLTWFRIGGFGVDLFFVISGLVVSLSAFAAIDRFGARGFAGTFMRRRLARIVPLYYLTAFAFTLFIVPHFFFQANFWPNALSHVLFVHNLFPDMAGSMDGVNWSIGVEMQFYLLIVLLAPVMRRCRWWMIPAVAVPVAWAWRLGAVMLVAEPPQGLTSLFWASTQLPGTLDEFAAGVLLARLLRSGRLSAWRGGRHGSWALPLVVSIAASLLLWVTFTLYWRHSGYWDAPWMVVGWRSLCGVSWAAVVLVACLVQTRWLVRLTGPLRYCGTISYGIYLWHLLVISAFQHLTWLTAERGFPVIVAVTLLLAAGSWHLFEQPAMQRFSRRQQGTGSAVALGLAAQ